MKSLLKYERKVLNMKQIVNAVVSNEIENVKEKEVMSNVVEVFGVNAVEVKEEVRKLVEVYKASGKRATLKEWGHKMTDEVWGRNYVIKQFLRILFEEKNDDLINEVLNEENVSNLFYKASFEMLYARRENENWNCEWISDYERLAYTWAVFNLPILQEVMDALVEYMKENPDYLDDCYAVDDMMQDIKYNGCSYLLSDFQSYVSPYIVEFLEDFNLVKLAFDEDKAEEIDLDNLEYMWNAFCRTEAIDVILLSYYEDFMVDAVREVLDYKGF